MTDEEIDRMERDIHQTWPEVIGRRVTYDAARALISEVRRLRSLPVTRSCGARGFRRPEPAEQWRCGHRDAKPGNITLDAPPPDEPVKDWTIDDALAWADVHKGRSALMLAAEVRRLNESEASLRSRLTDVKELAAVRGVAMMEAQAECERLKSALREVRDASRDTHSQHVAAVALDAAKEVSR